VFGIINPESLAKMAREAASDEQLVRRQHESLKIRTGRGSSVPKFNLISDETDIYYGTYVHGNLDYIEQCISNLVDNAFKYSRPDCCIHIEVSYGLDFVELSVESKPLPLLDMDENDMRNCRKKEWRSDGAISCDADGNGLGLWFVDRVMEAHGGKLIIEKSTHPGRIGMNRFVLRFTLKQLDKKPKR
jgi:signal transduction histidine kinase